MSFSFSEWAANYSSLVLDHKPCFKIWFLHQLQCSALSPHSLDPQYESISLPARPLAWLLLLEISFSWMSAEDDQLIYDAIWTTTDTLSKGYCWRSEWCQYCCLSQLCHFRYTASQVVRCECTETTGDQKGNRPRQCDGSCWWFQTLILF